MHTSPQSHKIPPCHCGSCDCGSASRNYGFAPPAISRSDLPREPPLCMAKGLPGGEDQLAKEQLARPGKVEQTTCKMPTSSNQIVLAPASSSRDSSCAVR